MPSNAQAHNDTVSDTAGRSYTIDVTNNDDGSGIKLYSLDQANPTHAATSGVSALGATVTIQNGKIVYSADSAQIDALAAGQHATDTFTYTIKAANGTYSTATVTINLTGTNDAPVVTGSVTGSVNEGGAVSSLDALSNAHDPDGTALSVVSVPTHLPTGVTYDAASHSFKLDPTNPVFQSMNAGDTQTVSVSYQVSDGSLKTNDTLNWVVHGTNDIPTITGVATGTVVEGSLLQLGAAGVLHISDPDAGESHFAGSTIQFGDYGAFAFDANTGVWGYLVNNAKIQFLGAGDTATDTLTVKSADGSASQDIVVTIKGVNDAATMTGTKTGAVTEGSATQHTATGTLTVSDADQGQAKLAIPANLNGTYGTFVVDQATGQWTYTLDDAKAAPLKAGQTATDSITLTSVDGTASQQVVVTITGTDTAPKIAGAVTGQVSGSAPSSLDALANATDSEGGHLSVVGVPSGLPAGVTYDPATHSFTLNPADHAYDSLAQGETQTVTVSYGVSDGVNTTPASVSWTITGSNDAPVVAGAVTGAATQGGLSTVNALGTASDVDHGSVLSVTGVPSSLPAGVSYDAATHSFTLNSADPAYQSLAQGETQTVTVTYAVSDGITSTPASVSWTVTGTNDAPTVGTPLAGAAADGSAPSAVDALSGAADVDHGAVLAVTNVPTTLPPGVTYDPATHSFSLDGSNSAYDHLAAGQTQTVSVTYGVTDGLATTPQTITWTVTGANDAPVVSAALTGAATDGAAPSTVDALSGASDVDDGSHLSVVQPAELPAGVTYDAATHSFSLDASDPAYAHLAAGAQTTVTVSFGVSDGTATTAQSITWTVTGANDAPAVTGALTGSAADGSAPSTVDALNGASDVDDGSHLSVVNVPADLPAGVTYDPATHSFSLDGSNSAYDHLAAGQQTTVSVTFGVSDGTATTPQTLTWTVTGANDAPVVSAALTGAATDGAAPSTVDALSGASDVDDGSHLSVVNVPSDLPAGVTYDAATHSFSLDGSNSAYDHLAAGEQTTVTVSFGVSDGTVTTPQTLTWTVTGANDAPVVAAALTGTATDGAAPATVDALSGASDVDDGSHLSVVGVPSDLPAGVTYDAATHSFSLDASNSAYDHLAAGQQTTVSVTFGVSDGTATTPQTVTWTVTGVNDAPVVSSALTGAATDGAAPSTVDALSGASDVDDGSHLSVVQPSSLPAGVTYDAATHSFSLDASDPAYAHLAAGQQTAVTLDYGVSDGTATTAQSITWTVTGVNDAPVVSAALTGAATDGAAPSTVDALSGASDVDDGSHLSVVQPASLPAGVTYDAATHSFSLDASDPAYAHLAAGQQTTVTLDYGVSDGAATTAQSITWTVTGINDAPVVSAALTGAATDGAAPSTVDALSGASDVDDGSHLSVVQPSSLPAGVTYDAATHSFSLDASDPAYAHLAAGQQTAVTLDYGVSDGTATTAQSVTWTVTGANDAPVVSAALTGAATEGGVSTVNALSGASDVDDGATLSVVQPSPLPAGVTYDAATHSFSLDAGNAAYQALAAGETQTVALSYGITDGVATTAQTITWTVTGVNDAPVTTTVVGHAVEGGGAASVDALSGASDVDHGAVLNVVNVPTNLPAGVTYDAATHSFTLDPTVAAYAPLSQGQVQTVTVDYGVSDGTATTAAHVSWQVTGSNDPSVILAGGDLQGSILEADHGTVPSASITPVIAEVEPNNTVATAQTLDLSLLRVAPNANLYDLTVPAVAINGAISAVTDADYYKLHLNAGQFITLDVDTPSSSALDSYIFLYNSSGTQIAFDDDSTVGQGGAGSTKPQDSFLQFTVPTTGDYYLMIKDFDQQGQSSTGAYVLNVSVNDQSLPLSDTGFFAFTDDIQDTHAVSVAANGTGYVGALTAVVTDDTVGDGSGRVDWTFSVPASQVQYLAQDQTLTQNYTVSLTDSAGDVQTTAVSVVIKGVNDGPAIIASTGEPVIYVGAGSSSSEVTSGTFTFVDADLTDIHHLTVSGATSNFTAYLIQDSTGTGTGTVYWQAVGTTGSDSRIDMTVTDNHGASTAQEIVFSASNATLPAGAGNDTFSATTAVDTFTGGAGNDVFRFAKGTANGDHITDFDGHLSAPGDTLVFSGYGAGATFTQIDATHWQINYSGGAQHEIITFDNGAQITPGDFSFVS